MQPHTHSYVFWRRRKGIKYYKCNDPSCLHTAPYDVIIGKNCLCNSCHAHVFILTWEDLRRAQPRCLNCSNTSKAQTFRKTKALVETLFPEESSLASKDQ